MSTFSPDLRIELIATGDQAGVWGTTTNTNLGTLLESAIAGYTSVALSTPNYALTAYLGAPDEARFACIAFTSIYGATTNVFVPPTPKLYIIKNTGAYSVIIYNSTVLGNTTAAGLGTTVPSGKTMALWTDGTDVQQQSTYLNGATSTQTAKTADGSIASTLFVDGLRSLLTSSTSGGGTAVLSDRGSLIAVSTGITVPNSVFTFGDVFTIANSGSGSITITQGSGLTMYLVGTATTGNRTLAQKGLATVVFTSSSTCIISGGGVS